VVAYDISCLMEYKGLDLAEACRFVVNKLNQQDPECGGLIAIDKSGEICFEFNTPGMYRGLILENGISETFIYS
jgi:beta-aspartyl-peptidase (threonine type)